LANKEKLSNIRLDIEYDGRNYYGWQRQSKASRQKTIQQTIEESLQVIFPGEVIKLTGAGRTDTGVHAYLQTANFRVSQSGFKKYGTLGIQHRLNGILPEDIIIKKAAKVNSKFHARYSAKSRVYRYFLTAKRTAINREKLYFVKTEFDIDLAKVFCKFITGVHSFKSLCKNKTDEHGFLSNVISASIVKEKEGILRFEICANRFLHSMVRAIVGAMVRIASGKLTLKKFKEKFKKGEVINIQYVPSNALFLYKVNY
jgi:tRNA pseudouridine38-40 synthase